MMNCIRRTLLALAVVPVVLVTGLFAAAPATAQGYPRAPVRMILPFPAGSATDLMFRTLAGSMEKGLGQKVIIDPKPGDSMLARFGPGPKGLMASEVRPLDGSMASTATLWPAAVRFRPNASMVVDLPAPGTPVIPSRWARPVSGMSCSSSCRAAA